MLETECPSPDTFLRFVDGRSDEADGLRVEQHLDACTLCRELVAQMALDRFARSSAVESTLPLTGASQSGIPFIAGNPRDYHIEGILSRGGLGIVWRARDLRLGRVVALKQMLLTGPEAARRFRREIELTARMQHPSIVSVYEAGSWPSGEPFYAMRLVEGRTLHERIALARDFGARIELVPHVIAVAEAVAYAHTAGVIHRDLKPSNVVVGAFGETIVIDWGLAKELDEPDDAKVMGTPTYMPPEQARGDAVDARADVYAAGAMLYHVLTGSPPYAAADSREVLRKLAAGSPLPVDEHAPETPADLASIVARAMARDPEARYPSARELAEDLRRFSTGQLVTAYRYSLLALLLRWVRRHRLLVVVSAVLVAALVTTAVLSVLRIARERGEVKRRRDELILTQARSTLAQDPTATLAWIKQYPSDGAAWPEARALVSEAEVLGVARYVLPSTIELTAPAHPLVAGYSTEREVVFVDLARDITRRFANPGDPDPTLAFFDDGKRALSVGPQNRLTTWDIETGARRVVWSGGDRDLVFNPWTAPGGKWLLAQTPNGARLWLPDGGAPRDLSAGRGLLESVVFSRDGSRLLTAHADHKVRLWDAATGSPRELAGHTGTVRDVDFSPDGTRAASAGIDGTLRIWDLSTGEARVLSGHEGAIYGLDWSPDGNSVATAGLDRTVRIWDARTGEARVLSGHEGAVVNVAFSPDGGSLVSSSEDMTLRLWTVADGSARVLRGHRGPVLTVRFTQDGRWILSRGFDSRLRVWSTAPPSGELLRRGTGEPAAMLLLPDGRLALAWMTGAIEVCAPGGSCRALGAHQAPVALSLSPAGDELAAASMDGTAEVWNLGDGSSLALPVLEAGCRKVVFTPDGKQVARICDDRTLRLWSRETATERVLLEFDDLPFDLVISGDGRWLAASGFERGVRLVDLTTGETRKLPGHLNWTLRLAFSADGRTLVSGSFDKTVRVWNLATGEARVLRHGERVRPVAVTADGRLVASGATDGSLTLWEPATGAGRPLRGHQGEVRALAFSPDGTRLASGGVDKTVRLWSVGDGEGRVLGTHDGMVRGLVFSADGTQLVSAGGDGTIRRWRVAGEPRPTAAALTSAVVTPEGEILTP